MSDEKSDNFANFQVKPLRKLSDYETYLRRLLRLVASEVDFSSKPDLQNILAEHQRLIVVFSHASPLSWIPAPCLMCVKLVEAGGGGRTPISVMDRFFYSLPGLRALAHYITQSSKPLSFKELLEHFIGLKTADLVVFPEGSNCLFGHSHEIQEFRSERFVEISIRTKTPMLLCVHRGSENWGHSISIDEKWLEKLPERFRGLLWPRLHTSRRLTIPGLPRPMSLFSMRCELFHCESNDISNEAAKVHQRMRTMLKELDNEIADRAL